jgi:hypothetical protein
MLKPYAERILILICPLLLLAACGPSDQHRTARLLDQRLQARLAPDIAAGNAVFQPLPDGARITLLSRSQFPNDVQALDDKTRDVRASVIEGLLDPELMRIDVADTSTLPNYQRDTRVQDVRQYFEAVGLGSTLQAMPPEPAAATPAGLTITIAVQCPQRHDGAGYRSGRAKPACY